ncbi:MAG: site-2 protease family protein [Patescibacteria group bacterium]|nr:site-2 protease family protein [Patescibacteria group bacterium]
MVIFAQLVINLLSENPALFFVYLVVLVLAITIHEFAHAWTAYQLGDPTPKLQGRLNLNPRSHLDPLGILFLFFFGFGWGRPVEIDPFNLKNPRKDTALVSFAGPLSNFILAILSSSLLRLFIFFESYFLKTIGFLFLVPVIQINIFLGLFNLIPVAPLDGFKIVGGILSRERAQEWYRLEKYGLIFLILMIIPIGGFSMLDNFLRPTANFIIRLLIPPIR